jgi:hypothetical protein
VAPAGDEAEATAYEERQAAREDSEQRGRWAVRALRAVEAWRGRCSRSYGFANIPVCPNSQFDVPIWGWLVEWQFAYSRRLQKMCSWLS